jgi:hypothetical protein
MTLATLNARVEEAMKTVLIVAPLVLLVVGTVFAQSPSEQRSASSTKAKHESPLACDRLALTPEQRRRHFDELGSMLRSLKTSVRELSDGFEFQYPSDMKTYQLVAEWAAGERVCCPFFEIDLRSEPEGGPLWLRLTGRDGVKEFLQAEGAAWIKP